MKISHIVAASIGAIFLLLCFYQIQVQTNVNEEVAKLSICEKHYDNEDYISATTCYADLVELKKRNYYRFKRALMNLNTNQPQEAKSDLEYIIKTEKKNKVLLAKAKYLYENTDEYINKIGANYSELEQQESETGIQSSTPVYNDYFIFTATEMKWEDPKKIKVFINKNDKNYTNFVKAFTMWGEKLDGVVNFSFIDSEADASIVCKTIGKLSTQASANVISATNSTGGVVWYASDMEQRYYKQMEIEILANYRTGNEPIEENKVLASILHEIGHALGIAWHSGQPTDIMYEPSYGSTPDEPTISARDVNTVKKLYNNF